MKTYINDNAIAIELKRMNKEIEKLKTGDIDYNHIKESISKIIDEYKTVIDTMVNSLELDNTNTRIELMEALETLEVIQGEHILMQHKLNSLGVSDVFEIKTKITDLEDEIKALTALTASNANDSNLRIKENTEDIETLTSQFEAIKSDLISLGVNIRNELATFRNSLEDGLTDLYDERIASVEASVANFDYKIKSTDSSLISLMNRINSIEEDVETIEDFMRNISAFEDRIANAEQAALDAKSTANGYQTQITEISNEIKEAINGYKLINKRLDEVEGMSIEQVKTIVIEEIKSIEVGDIIDLTGYYTSRQVDTLIETINTVEPSKYYTKEEVTALLEEVDLSEYYTTVQVDAIIDSLESVDLTGYYTATEVDNLIEAIEGTDLTNYYTIEQVDTLLDSLEQVSVETCDLTQLENTTENILTEINMSDEKIMNQLTSNKQYFNNTLTEQYNGLAALIKGDTVKPSDQKIEVYGQIEIERVDIIHELSDYTDLNVSGNIIALMFRITEQSRNEDYRITSLKFQLTEDDYMHGMDERLIATITIDSSNSKINEKTKHYDGNQIIISIPENILEDHNDIYASITELTIENIKTKEQVKHIPNHDNSDEISDLGFLIRLFIIFKPQ